MSTTLAQVCRSSHRGSGTGRPQFFMVRSCPLPTLACMQTAALVVASCSAVGFALSTSLQHRAADRAPQTVRGSHRLLAHLAARPWWLIGQLIALVSFALHAAALRLGPLMLVQPVVVSGIVLAVPVGAALSRRAPSRGELGTVAMTAVGLALFLVAAHPTAGHVSTGGPAAPLLTAGGVVAAWLAAWRGGRSTSASRSAAWFGTGAGILFGLVAGLVKLAISTVSATVTSTGNGAGFAGHVLAALITWSPWAVLVVGLSGVALNQRAYRAARLSASMPLLNMVDVLVAVAFGFLVFGETPGQSVAAVTGQLVALVCVGLGLRSLGRLGALDDLNREASLPHLAGTALPAGRPVPGTYPPDKGLS
jgi:hypothetical protein